MVAILAEHRISGLPVISEQRRVLGFVSEADVVVKERGPEPRHGGLFGWLLAGSLADEEKLAARTAGEAMTSPPITIRAYRHVPEAARLMTENGIKRLPVVDADGKLIGIVTRSDLVRAFARPDEEIEREIREDVRTALWIEGEGLDLRVERRGDALRRARTALRRGVAAARDSASSGSGHGALNPHVALG